MRKVFFTFLLLSELLTNSVSAEVGACWTGRQTVGCYDTYSLVCLRNGELVPYARAVIDWCHNCLVSAAYSKDMNNPFPDGFDDLIEGLDDCTERTLGGK